MIDKNVLMDKSEDYQEGYHKGYIKGYSDKKTAVNKAKREAEAEYRNKLAHLEISSVYPFNLIEEIWSEIEEKDPFEKHMYSLEAINEVLKDLTDRERRCLEMMYRDKMTLDEIGKEFNVTRERIRQVIAKAIRKLKHPHRMNAMQVVPKSKYNGLMAQYIRLEKDYEDLLASCINAGLSKPIKKQAEEPNILDQGIDTLDLSVRSYNCLHRANIKTIGDLTVRTITEIQHIRNLGKRSFVEIRDKLYDLGLSFTPEEFNYGNTY